MPFLRDSWMPNNKKAPRRRLRDAEASGSRSVGDGSAHVARSTGVSAGHLLSVEVHAGLAWWAVQGSNL